MNLYLDTSIVLRILFGEPRPLREWGTWENGFTSELFGVEARRTIDRMRLTGLFDDGQVAALESELRRVEQTLSRVPVSRAVLARASAPMRTAVRTLDAVHLASALLIRERRMPDLVFAAHDEQLAIAAQAHGFPVLGVAG